MELADAMDYANSELNPGHAYCVLDNFPLHGTKC
jgi:hypothetical protein